MISRHHYPDPLDKYGDAEHDRALARLAADLGGVPLAPRGDRTFPPPAPGVCDCDEPTVTMELSPAKVRPVLRDNRGNAWDIGEPWSPRVVKALGWFVFWTVCLTLGWVCGGWLGGVL